MKKILLILTLAPTLTMCQPLSLKGKIINEQNEPVANATITIKRSPQQLNLSTPLPSAIANNKGQFSLTNLHLNDTLIISAVGYQTATEVYDYTLQGHNLTIVLKRKSSTMQEVIINTGYQSLPRERTTGSFSQVSNAALNLQTGTNILDRLEGVSPATLFDHNSNRPAITIRGLSTINGPKAPLVVVDNFPIEGDINTINPADVESITILKDAAAASIWGARAGNGVIVITTKKARYNQPLKIDVGTSFTLRQPDDLSYLKTMSPADVVELEKFLFSKGYYNSRENSASRPLLSPAVEILIRLRNGLLSDTEAQEQLNALGRHDVKTDYQNHFYRNDLTTQNYLSLSGGSASLAYKLFGGLDKNLSQLSATWQRFTLASETSFRITGNLLLNTSLSYVSVNSQSGKAPYGSIYLNNTQRLYPYARLIDDNGNALPLYTYRQTYIDTAGAGLLQDWRFYPANDYTYNPVTTNLSSLVGQLALSYKFLQWFKLDARYQYQKQQSTASDWHQPQSFFTRDLVNRFSQINAATGTVSYIVPNDGILDRSVNSITAQTLRGQIGFDHSFGRQALVIIAGSEVRQSATNASSFRAYGYSDDPLKVAPVDYVNTYPTFITGSKQSIPGSPSFISKTYRFLSFYTNAEYTYHSRYSVSLSARKDASNLFGLNTNDKWNPLWSAGAAWELSKEAFYRCKALPYLKLRATWGFSGNVDPSKSAVTTIRYLTASYTGYPSANFIQYINPDLRWERSAMLNLGLDFQTANAVLWGSIEYYKKKGSDLFGPAPLDYTAGLNLRTVTKNVAAMKGSGVDLTLNAELLSHRFSWEAALLFSYNHSIITSYYASGNLALNFVGSGSTISGLEGRPVYSILTFKSAGLDAAGNPRGYINDTLSTNYNALTGSNVLVSDLQYSGSAIPRYFGSLNNSFNWKRFTASVLLTYKLGYNFLKESVNYGQSFSQYFTNNDYERRWQKPGDEAHTSVPALVYPNNSNRDLFYTYSNVLVRKGDHIRLSTVNIGYTIPLKAKAALRSLQLVLNASNLGIIWKANKDGIDPDYGSVIPPSLSISFGLKATL